MDIIHHSIKPTKEKAWHYKSHPYFTKQAYNVVAEYIEHFSKEGDTVLDPYGGTGVTAIEALRLKRKVIITDINPFACFLIKATCRKVNINDLKKTFEKLKDKVSEEIQQYYKTDIEEVMNIPVNYWYPKDIPLPSNADFDFVHNLYTKRQLLSYALLWHEIIKIKDESMQEMMKYTFSATMAKVNLTYMDNPNRGSEGGGSSIFGKFRYWKPKKIAELNVWKNFEKKFSYILKGKQEWEQLTHGMDTDKMLTVLNCSALEISKHIPKNSVDYIYTDPPYGANIAYLDLSTMFNAWLGFKVTKEMRKEEVIEGGDLKKSKDEYETLLSNSFEEMGKVLKKDKWISVVFAHKKLEFWNTIIESCENNGMEFKGSTFQATNNSSVHYKTNPANVLCSQRIASFEKTFQRSKREAPNDYKQYIIDEIKNVCKLNGASIDAIYNRVLDKLHNESKAIHEFKKKGYLNLDPFLGDTELFEFNKDTGLYYVKDHKENHEQYEKEYYANKDQLKLFMSSMLKDSKGKKLEELQNEVLDVFNADKQVPIKHRDFFEVLKEIAEPVKNKWVAKKYIQHEIGFTTLLKHHARLIKITPQGNNHSEIIYRLYIIGKYLEYNIWIGKKEQGRDGFNGERFGDISLQKFPIDIEDTNERTKIEQIDLIWFDNNGTPKYAFEIEDSTTMISGLDRFKYLLELEHSIANSLAIVAPKSRKRTLEKVFYKSTYVGAPLYMDNKVKFAFSEDIARFYDRNIDKDFNENDLKAIFSKVEQ